MPAAIREAYHQRMTDLLSIQLAHNEFGIVTPRRLALAPGAKTRLHEYEEFIEPQLAEFGALGSMTDWGGKLFGAVCRVAGLLHMVEHAGDPEPWSTPVALKTVEAAIELGQYLVPHAKAAFQLMGADELVESAKYLLRWVQRTGASTFSKREAFEGTKGRFKRVAELEPAIGVLVEHNYVRELADETERRPGRRKSPRYQVNPASQNSHNSHNSPPVNNSANSADSAKGSNGEKLSSEPETAPPEDPPSNEEKEWRL